jgi:hypothetical protein
MPPGWRPRNLGPYDNKGPHTNAKDQIKYVSNALPNSSVYLTMQMILSMGVLILIIRTDSPLTILERVLIGLSLWLGITFWAAILESKKWARVGEIVRIGISATLLGSVIATHDFGTFWMGALGAVTLASAAWVLIGMRPKTEMARA